VARAERTGAGEKMIGRAFGDLRQHGTKTRRQMIR
jgi:hypothetical protein